MHPSVRQVVLMRRVLWDFTLGVLPAGTTYSGNGGNGTLFNSSGVRVQSVANVARFTYDPVTLAALGAYVEPASTNLIRNSGTTGAAAGTPGTLPTNWTEFTVPTGLTRQIVAVGTLNGIPYMDIRWSGTASGAGDISLLPESRTNLLMSAGTAVAQTMRVALIAGSTANLAFISLQLQSFNGVTFLSQGALNIKASLTSDLARFEQAYTTALTSDRVQPVLTSMVTAAGAVDFTLRIAAVQLEVGATASSGIPTTGSTVTRTADVLTITALPAGNWRLTFGDNTTLDVAHAGGDYAVPTAASRSLKTARRI